MNDKAIFRVENLRKSFGPNRVLDGVSIDLQPGAVTVLMGANGAGKSTLVKTVCGVYQPDSGSLTLDGAPFAPASTAEAIRAGVVTVHQNINDGVIADLDVATNLMLDRLTGWGKPLLFNPFRIRREAREVADRMGLAVDLKAEVANRAAVRSGRAAEGRRRGHSLYFSPDVRHPASRRPDRIAARRTHRRHVRRSGSRL
jgi:simple sugar transport system ATP-binding protein